MGDKPKTGDIRVRIVQDDMNDTPRDWDTLGTMVCWHPRYDLGDKHEFKAPEDFKEFMKEHSFEMVVLPLYLYDHSGITMSTELNYPFNDRWDAGQVGWIYCMFDRVKLEWGKVTEVTVKKTKDVLRGEVETYDKYLTGDVWGYIVERCSVCPTCGDIQWEALDSCWGFYGSNPEKNGMVDHIPSEYLDKLKEAEYECG